MTGALNPFTVSGGRAVAATSPLTRENVSAHSRICPGSAGGAEPLGQVHRRSDGGVIEPIVRPDAADQHVPGRDTDPDRQRGVIAAGARDGSLNLQAAPDGVEGHVRSGEVREHGVADELVDVAAEALDEVGLQAQIPVEHGHGVFRRGASPEKLVNPRMSEKSTVMTLRSPPRPPGSGRR